MSNIRPGKYKACRVCGTPREELPYLSARGLCQPCGLDRAGESARQMAAREGPYYDEWKRSMAHGLTRFLAELDA